MCLSLTTDTTEGRLPRRAISLRFNLKHIVDYEQWIVSSGGRLHDRNGAVKTRGSESIYMMEQPGISLQMNDIIGMSLCENGILCVYQNYTLHNSRQSRQAVINSKYIGAKRRIASTFDHEWTAVVNVCHSTEEIVLLPLDCQNTPPFFKCCF